jgi:Xaa-Pro dipeptidase
MPLTRRAWISISGAAAAGAAGTAWPAVLPTEGTPAQATPEPASPLPAPLAADVFRDRQARLRASAKSRGLDALFVTPSTNLAWTANLAIGRSERLTALILSTEGPAILVTPRFEAENHRLDAVVDDIVTWNEDEDPMPLVVRALDKAKAKTLGIEGSTAYHTATKLLETANGVAAQDATALFDALRMIKSPEEQAFIRDAARRTSLAIAAVHRGLARGISESETAALLEREFHKLGVRGGGLVQFGPSAALPHGGPGDRRLAAGDVVLIDAGCKVRGYTSDVTRTVSFGPPKDEVRKVYDVVDRAQRAGIEALRAGASGEDVDRAARRVVDQGGYGEFFTHRLGHGLGMDGHEPPYLVRGNTVPLKTGNTVTVEPGIYLPGKFGVRIEDDFAVRESAPPAGLSERPGALTVLSA